MEAGRRGVKREADEACPFSGDIDVAHLSPAALPGDRKAAGEGYRDPKGIP